MFYIILLIVLGLFFLIAELVLLPGVSIGAFLSLVCYGTSIYMAFDHYDVSGGLIVIFIVFLLSVVATIWSLRSNTWQRFSLKQKLESQSVASPEGQLQIGDKGLSISRLSPMGKVEIRGRIFEAKSKDVYIDPKSEIEVVGFENFSVIVKRTTN